MAWKNTDGEKTTPKQLAQDLLMDYVANALGYGFERLEENGLTLTEKQKEIVGDQLQKQADRIAKMFGFEKAWSN